MLALLTVYLHTVTVNVVGANGIPWFLPNVITYWGRHITYCHGRKYHITYGRQVTACDRPDRQAGTQAGRVRIAHRLRSYYGRKTDGLTTWDILEEAPVAQHIQRRS